MATNANGNTAGVGITTTTGTGTSIISAPVALGGSQQWNLATGTTLSVSGLLSGNNNLTVNSTGTGTLLLTNVGNTASGTLTVTPARCRGATRGNGKFPCGFQRDHRRQRGDA